MQVFTASGTYRGQHGEIVERARNGAFVLVEGEEQPLLFSDREIVREERHFAGAE